MTFLTVYTFQNSFNNSF